MRKVGIVAAAISVAALFVLPNAVQAGITNQMEAGA